MFKKKLLNRVWHGIREEFPITFEMPLHRVLPFIWYGILSIDKSKYQRTPRNVRDAVLVIASKFSQVLILHRKKMHLNFISM